MEKDLRPGWMLDFYGGFLTDKQKKLLDLYYNQDYSLAEIAEGEGISRQGVLDIVHRGVKKLITMENELGMLHKYDRVRRSLDDCRALLSDRAAAGEKKDWIDAVSAHIDDAMRALGGPEWRLKD